MKYASSYAFLRTALIHYEVIAQWLIILGEVYIFWGYVIFPITHLFHVSLICIVKGYLGCFLWINIFEVGRVYFRERTSKIWCYNVISACVCL